jgi:hypothetical protein
MQSLVIRPGKNSFELQIENQKITKSNDEFHTLKQRIRSEFPFFLLRDVDLIPYFEQLKGSVH